MPSAYTGAWLRNAYKDPLQAPLHTADPAHGDTTIDDPNAFVYDAPPIAAAADEITPDLSQYPGEEWVVTSPGFMLDTTDYQDHTQGSGSIASTPDDSGYINESVAIHGVEQGASRQIQHYETPLQFPDEQYWTAYDNGIDRQEISQTAIRRGMNGDPENTPEGSYRLGVNFSSGVKRKFYVGERTHDMHLLTPNTVTPPTRTPPVPTPYGSPFGNLARAITNTFATPSVRREPPAIDTVLLSDGTEGTYASYPQTSDWVVG